MARVRKIMSADVQTLKKEAKIWDAARLLAKKESGCVVITEGKKTIGIVTELDLVRHIANGREVMKGSVSKIMSSSVVSLNPDTKLDEALKTIDTRKFRRYPVLEKGELVGLITKNDVVNAISDNVRVHRAIQNTVLIIFVLFELFVFILYTPLVIFLGG
jgi:CBS domain-containing protein